LVSEGQLAWLVGASYKPGRVSLSLIASEDLEPIEWVDPNFQPYYLATQKQGEPIKKIDLFAGNELRDDTEAPGIPQPYQAAWLLAQQGKAPARGESIGFVKVLPFRLAGRQFTVKPTSQATPKEIDVDDYALSLYASLSQAFDPMNIKLARNPTSLSDFV